MEGLIIRKTAKHLKWRNKFHLFLKRLISSERKRRFELASRHISSFERPIRILDVGGTVEFWQEANFSPGENVSITLLNLFQHTILPSRFFGEIGDARDLYMFPDKSFDFVVSHSVINLVGSWENQVRMAKEIQRVGNTYFVQCPNRFFPIDWRTLMPFFHYLSPNNQALCLSRFRVGRYPRCSREQALWLASRVSDLSAGQMRMLFPYACIRRDRWFGLTKSIVAYKLTQQS